MFAAVVRGGKIALRSDNEREKARLWCAENEGARLEIVPLVPDSRRQRRFYHGAVIPLWAFLDGKDYRDHQVLADLHEIAKVEFNGEAIVVNGVLHKVGRSTAGKLKDGFLERVISYLEENYGIDRAVVLDPEQYKRFADEVYSFGKYETYIDYMLDMGWLKKPLNH